MFFMLMLTLLLMLLLLTLWPADVHTAYCPAPGNNVGNVDSDQPWAVTILRGLHNLPRLFTLYTVQMSHLQCVQCKWAERELPKNIVTSMLDKDA